MDADNFVAVARRRDGVGVNDINWRNELERLHPMSFAWALYCCRRQREEAQDVLQEVYLRILDGRARFGGESTVKTWLFAVIRRTAAERTRRRWWRAALLEKWLTAEPAHDPRCDPEGDLDASDSHETLRTALTRLSRRQHELLHLVFYQDLTIEEASATLGISLGSARTHFERGKARLRELLAAAAAP